MQFSFLVSLSKGFFLQWPTFCNGKKFCNQLWLNCSPKSRLLIEIDLNLTKIVFFLLYNIPKRFEGNKDMRSLVTNFHFDECSLLRKSPGQNPGITEAGPQQHGHNKQEEQHSKDWDGRGQMDSQVWTSANQEVKLWSKSSQKHRFCVTTSKAARCFLVLND